MMRRIPSLLALLLLASLLSGGCVPGDWLPKGFDYERIDIQSGKDKYEGRVISSNYKDVEVTSSGILLKPGARFAVKTPNVTQFIGQFEAQILSGEGMTVYLRTASNNFDPKDGIAFKYSTTGCTVRLPGGKTVQLKHNAETDQQMLTMSNEAGLLGLQVGCSKLYEGYTDAPGTEYVIFETLPNSSVELRSMNYFNSDAE